jgi:chorismate synthase
MAAIEIRTLRALSEMRGVVELQQTYWGGDAESVIPAHMLFSLANHGGHVLAAFDDQEIVGALVGFLGTSEQDSERPAMAGLQIVSKRMIVLPDYRNHGVGYRLKLAQRELALKQAIRLVTWTFDPLLSTNAHLNIRKLGATAHVYLEDYYGTENEGGLTTLGSSDRLQVEWWVTNRRVEERLFGNRPELNLEHYLGANTVILNPTTSTDDGAILPSQLATVPAGSFALLEIPVNYSGLVSENPALAQTWRVHSRVLFKTVFGAGYIVTDFLRTEFEGRERAFYLLSYNGPQFDNYNLN